MQRTTFQQANDYTGARTVVRSWRARRRAVAAAMARARQDLRMRIGTMSTSNEMWWLFVHTMKRYATALYITHSQAASGGEETAWAPLLTHVHHTHVFVHVKVSKRIRILMFICMWCAGNEARGNTDY